MRTTGRPSVMRDNRALGGDNTKMHVPWRGLPLSTYDVAGVNEVAHHVDLARLGSVAVVINRRSVSSHVTARSLLLHCARLASQQQKSVPRSKCYSTALAERLLLTALR
eukprot:COSAG05_NODE_6417_length_962_cov_4.244496_2_plen_109_part_00